ncbi:diguanylate cyclase [Dokdonella sp.]|uniref:GGDEF domain-containing protein n=1 Tax=Dokdonella sp. TaxID=2291710 RepID=UPI003526D519
MTTTAVNIPLLLLMASMAIAAGLLMSAANQPSPIREAQRVWALGLVAGPLGLALLRLGGLLEAGLLQAAAKTIMTAGFSFPLIALALISGASIRWRALLPVVLVLAASMIFLLRFPEAPMRTGLLSLVCSLTCMLAAQHAWHCVSRVETPYGRIVAFIFACGAAVLLARALMLFPMTGVDNGLTEMLLAAAVLIPALATVSFVLVCGDRMLMQLKLIASTDELTGSQSRRAFLENGRRQLNEARTRNLHTAALIIDVDDFKLVNDRFGHGVGDQALKKIASALRNQLREGDGFGRLGGEEFAVLLTGVNEAEALATAHRLREAVAGLRFSSDNISVPLRVSVGVAIDPGNSPDLDRLLERADLAMYSAKRNGRDQVAVSPCFEAAR